MSLLRLLLNYDRAAYDLSIDYTIDYTTEPPPPPLTAAELGPVQGTTTEQ